MHFNPKVSVIIPVFNGSQYMREAIDSALRQTYKNIEIIVVNDGSNDNGKTDEIAQSYGEKIRYFKKENGGVSSALNVGIKNMKGDYFSWLSHDDVYTQDKIEKEINALKKRNNEKTVVLCDSILVDKHCHPIVRIRKNISPGEFDWERSVMFITKHGANGCAFLIPRNAFEEAGYFDESLRYCQDILMWWKIFLAHYSLIIIPDKCVLSRVHESQETFKRANLYHHDAAYIGDIIPQKLFEVSTKDNNCLYEYAKGEAVHGNDKVCNKCISLLRIKRLVTFKDIVILKLLIVYGKVRPLLRYVYRTMINKS